MSVPTLDQKEASVASIAARAAVVRIGSTAWSRTAVPVVLISLAFGVLAARNPPEALTSLGVALVAAICFVGPKSRLAISIAGALIVFQSDLTSLKYAYLGLVLLCFALSVRCLFGADGWVREGYRAYVASAAVLITYIAFTALIAKANGTALDSWFRDALSYFLLVPLPVIGLAAGQTMSVRWSKGFCLLLGLLCSISMASDWLARRGVSALPFGRLLLSSTSVVAFGFAFALAVAGVPRTRFRWIWICALAVMAIAVLLTGSRTNLVLFTAFFGVVGLEKRLRVTVPRAVGLLVSLGLILVLAMPTLGSVFIKDPEFLQRRLDSALTVLQGEADKDSSFLERQESYTWTQESFTAHPWLGTGPGYLYNGLDDSPRMTFTLDAPGIVPAKFGIVGVSIIALYLMAIVATILGVRRRAGPLIAYTAARGWLLVLLVLIPFGPWLEDKGFPLALAMLFATITAESRARVRAAAEAGAG